MNRLRRALRDDRGLGLPELLITMVLIGVLTSAVVALFSSIASTFTKERSATDSANIAAIGMNEVTRIIRSGTEVPLLGGSRQRAVVAAGEDFLEFHAFIDTDSTSPEPVRVRFEIDGDRDLIEQRWTAIATSADTWTFPPSTATPDSERVIARKITPGTHLFTYFASTDPAATAMTVPTAGFTAAELSSIRQVGVSLTVQADLTDRAQPVTLVNRVGIPNLGVNVFGATTP